jgi:hypothetical protein
MSDPGPAAREITRRRALILLAAAGAAALLEPRLKVSQFLASPPRIGPIQESLLARFVAELDPEAARQLASDYLDRNPGESDADRLVNLVLEGAPPDESLSTWVRRSVQADFADSRTAKLAAWTVSRTEARLLAAVALSA